MSFYTVIVEALSESCPEWSVHFKQAGKCLAGKRQLQFFMQPGLLRVQE